ncbi:MAG: C25 family cysteine peptidase, partial [Thermoanaerobaculia bacterium]
ALENFGRPTVITQWGCWNTYHVMPTYDTLGHRLLLNDGRGAAAVLGAATLTEALSEQKLGRRLFAQIGSRRQRLGKALIDAKKDLALTDPERLDVLLGWTLLGDPTLVVEP